MKKITVFFTIFLLATLLSQQSLGAGAIRAYIRKNISPLPQPTCSTGFIEHEMPFGPTFLFGDAFGEKKALKIAKAAVKVCPTCNSMIYLGDTYPYGVMNKKDYAKKVWNVLKEFEFPYFYPTLGNHEYQGDPTLFLKMAGKCHHYAATKGPDVFVSIDTNRLTDANVRTVSNYLCSSDRKGLKVLFGHHPLWSNSTKERNKEESKTRDWLLPLVSKCVDLYLSGHDHHMEVIFNKEHGVLTHIQGGGGRSLRPIKTKIEGQLGIWKKHGFSVLDGKSLRVFDETGKQLGKTIEVLQ